MSTLRLLGCLVFSLSCLAQELTIAAASDLQAALPELVAAYEARSGKKVKVTFGSSGNFFAQIQNGAPFDLFFSADVEYAQRLEDAGLAVPGSQHIYGVGKIVLWVPRDSPLSLDGNGLAILKDARVQRIAIANPAHAPYGRAAKAALESAKLWESVKGKVVLGENISQAAQFVQSGNAQAGIIALALASSPKMSDGRYWLIPQELYPPLEQAVVILKRSARPTDAQEFLNFTKSSAGQLILQRYGFALSTVKVPKAQ